MEGIAATAHQGVHYDTRQDAALLVIRLASAIPFIYHGSGILFGAFAGPGIRGFSAFMHLPVFVAALVGLAEFAGGIAILTGVLPRLGAASVATVMLGAILLVHLPKGYDVTKGGMEYALTQLLVAIAIFISGAGRYTLLALLPDRSVSSNAIN